MAPVYEVRYSSGKGRGVFATENIKSGDRMMSDRPTMKITDCMIQLQDHEVQRAFDALTADQKVSFLQLHEGHRPLKSKMMRIYKANAFASGDQDNVLYLKVSLLNHSCVPNAEVATTPHEKEDTAVVAIKPITKDEEIFINYQTILSGMTTRQRGNVLQAYSGFRCACAACTAGMYPGTACGVLYWGEAGRM